MSDSIRRKEGQSPIPPQDIETPKTPTKREKTDKKIPFLSSSEQEPKEPPKLINDGAFKHMEVLRERRKSVKILEKDPKYLTNRALDNLLDCTFDDAKTNRGLCFKFTELYKKTGPDLAQEKEFVIKFKAIYKKIKNLPGVNEYVNDFPHFD